MVATAPPAPAPAPRRGRGLTGHLELVCSADEAGRSRLSRQSFRAPIHISKPHTDEGALVVNVVNPTAGLLEGDRIDCTVRVESGARLALTAPSASRAHRVIHGESLVRQTFSVAAGGWLEWWPELFIPQAGARYRQVTKLDVETGGSLLFMECIAPGRVASGEVLKFARLEWSTDLRIDGAPVGRERYRLEPESESTSTLQRLFPTPYYASCMVVAPTLHAESECWAAIHALHGPEVCIGVGPLAGAGWVVKTVTAGSVSMRRTLAIVRRELHAAMGCRPPALRRT